MHSNGGGPAAGCGRRGPRRWGERWRWGKDAQGVGRGRGGAGRRRGAPARQEPKSKPAVKPATKPNGVEDRPVAHAPDDPGTAPEPALDPVPERGSENKRIRHSWFSRGVVK